MNRTEANIVEAYIRANDVTGDDSSSWANDELRQCVWQEPDRSWPIILSIIERDPPLWVLTTLAAGPLEDLLRGHGPRFIDRVERDALRNERFRQVLAHIYPMACQPEVADRVRNVLVDERQK